MILAYIAAVYAPARGADEHASPSFQQHFIGLSSRSTCSTRRPTSSRSRTPSTSAERPGRIELDNVGFSYRPGRTCSRTSRSRVAAGEAVAIVGPTGAGKSTLASLMPRFYDPTRAAS